MALKKLESAIEKKEEPKSNMKIVECNKAVSKTLDEVQDLRSKIDKLKVELERYETQLEPRSEDLKAEAIDSMVEAGSFDSVRLTSTSGASIGIVVQDKYKSIKGDTEQYEKSVAELTGKDNVDKFIDFKHTVRAEALENEKVWELFAKFSADIESKFGVKLIEQRLEVKKGAIDNLFKIIKSKDKIKKLIGILKPQTNMVK